MDLGTIEKKLRNNTYTNPNQFLSDVRKIWSNAFTYNPRNSPVYSMTLEMSQYFEELNKQIDTPVEDLSVENKEIKDSKKSVKSSTVNQPNINNNNNNQSNQINNQANLNNSVIVTNPQSNVASSGNMDKPMSFQEKKS